MQEILRCAYDIVLFTTHRHFSFIEAVNLQQTLTVQYGLNDNSNTHILAGLPGPTHLPTALEYEKQLRRF